MSWPPLHAMRSVVHERLLRRSERVALLGIAAAVSSLDDSAGFGSEYTPASRPAEVKTRRRPEACGQSATARVRRLLSLTVQTKKVPHLAVSSSLMATQADTVARVE